MVRRLVWWSECQNICIQIEDEGNSPESVQRRRRRRGKIAYLEMLHINNIEPNNRRVEPDIRLCNVLPEIERAILNLT